jgi:hypothetical protein
MTRITVTVESFNDETQTWIRGSASRELQPEHGRSVVTREQISEAMLPVGDTALKGHARERSHLRRRHGRIL